MILILVIGPEFLGSEQKRMSKNGIAPNDKKNVAAAAYFGFSMADGGRSRI